MALTSAERKQLAAALGCSTSALSGELKKYSQAASEEYTRMILGQRVFTRGQDIREYRLLLLVQHVFGGRLPDERTISALFQTTANQSRALLRAVMSKYQYELQAPIRQTLRDAVAGATQRQGSDGYQVTIDSENVIDGLNREIGAIDGTLPQISKVRGTVATYEIQPSSYEKLRERLELEPR